MNRYLIAPLMIILFHASLQAEESVNSEEDQADNRFAIEQSQADDGSTSTSTKLGLVISKNNLLDLFYSASSVGYDGYGVSWNRKSKSGWSSWAYDFTGESGDMESHTLSADLGIKRQAWSAAIIPRFNTMHIYAETGPKSSTSLFSPGLAGSYTYHARNWDLGLEAGINFYNKRLDTYANNSRLLSIFDPMALQLVSGLEKSYLLANATRFQSWGEWGIQAINSISAIDFSASQSVSAHALFYVNPDWDLKLGYLSSKYQQSVSSSYSLILATYW